MPKLMSVNVGLPKDIAWKNRTVYTGAWKTPVTGRRMVRRLNIDGDGQGDLAGHGGENRAVLVYNSIHTVTGPRSFIATTWGQGFWVRI